MAHARHQVVPALEAVVVRAIQAQWLAVSSAWPLKLTDRSAFASPAAKEAPSGRL